MSTAAAPPSPVADSIPEGTPRWDWQALLHDWFVRFNPLYPASALSILAGVLTVARALAADDSPVGETLLSGALELYQFSLIGAAALLYRREGKARAAVILGLIAVFFGCDATFRTETASTLGALATESAALWLLVATIKVHALLRAFRLRIHRGSALLLFAGAASVALVPRLIATQALPPWFVLFGAIWLVPAAFFLHRGAPDLLQSYDPLDTWGHTVLGRASRAVWAMWTAFGLYHFIAWHVAAGIEPGIFHFTLPLLATSLYVDKERSAWLLTGLAAALGSLAVDSQIAQLVFVCGGCIAHALRRRQLRFIVGAAVAMSFALDAQHHQHWLLGDHLDIGHALLAAALVVLAVRERVLSALIVLIVGAAPEACAIATRLELTTLQSGMTILAGGFVLLGAGVAFDWRRRVRMDPAVLAAAEREVEELLRDGVASEITLPIAKMAGTSSEMG